MITTTFNKLRQVKDSLPAGSSAKIAAELGITADEVRAYFGNGNHIEAGPEGGVITLDDTRILEVALRMAWEQQA